MKNQLKADVRAELLKLYDPDTVRKGMARAERWIKAAYGSSGVSGYESRLEESGDLEQLVSFFTYYCSEVSVPGPTFNQMTGDARAANFSKGRGGK